MKKIGYTVLVVGCVGALLIAAAGCAKYGNTGDTTLKANGTGTSAAMSGAITVITREEGSGTRDAFVSLLNIDEITTAAEVTQSTGVVLTSVAQNDKAIGYISLGSLGDTVKALKIDGVAATAANVKNGTYKISRPFNIATKKDVSDIAKDFIKFILSTDGQKIVTDNGYVGIVDSNAVAFSGKKPSGTVKIAGSSSVTPIMEKLKEAYLKVNPNAVVEINESDSTTGINSVAEGVCDIGMASRDLKDSEAAKGLTATVIAKDGIAIIVSKDNTLNELTSEQVTKIYEGTVTDWSDIVS